MERRGPHDGWLRPLYLMLSGAFAVVGALFFFFPDGTIVTLDRVGAWFGFGPTPAMTHRFWLGLGTAYMVVVTVLAWLIAAAPTARRLLMLPLAAGKATSSLTCLLFLIFDHAYFVYLANFLVDGGLVLLILWTYRLTASGATPPGATTGGGTDGGAASDTARAVFFAAAEALLPPGGAIPVTAQRVDLAGRTLAFFAELGPPGRLGAELLARWLEWQPFLYGRWARFSRLPLEERIALLERMEHSHWSARRQAALALKLLLGIHAYGHPDLVAAVAPGKHAYLDEKLAAAAARREAGGKGPYPRPVAPPIQV